MGHSAPVWDCRAATEITQDWNGIDQVVLRNPKGASARVSFLLLFSWRLDKKSQCRSQSSFNLVLLFSLCFFLYFGFE